MEDVFLVFMGTEWNESHEEFLGIFSSFDKAKDFLGKKLYNYRAYLARYKKLKYLLDDIEEKVITPEEEDGIIFPYKKKWTWEVGEKLYDCHIYQMEIE